MVELLLAKEKKKPHANVKKAPARRPWKGHVKPATDFVPNATASKDIFRCQTEGSEGRLEQVPGTALVETVVGRRNPPLCDTKTWVVPYYWVL